MRSPMNEHHGRDGRDEARHRPAYDGPGWSESFVYELSTVDGFGVAVHVVVHPFERRTWYWAVVERPGEPVVAVVDLDVPLPSRPGSLELRTDGLWADHNVETPWRHVSVGLEAFGLALDDPRALLGDGRGDRVPVGLDLEWESTASDVTACTGPDAAGYEVVTRAHGELLVGPDAFELDGFGWREHRWGTIDWWDPAPSARLWVAADDRRREPAWRVTGPPSGPPPPGEAHQRRPAPGALPVAPPDPGGRSPVEFLVPSFGRRSARVVIGRARRADDPAAGAGWLHLVLAADDPDPPRPSS